MICPFTSVDNSCLAKVSDDNSIDNFKSNELAFPENLTVIKEICSPNETLPDSPSFQNAQDTDFFYVLELPTNLTSTLSFSMWTGGNVC
jgi:hypothetical protein